MTQRVTIDAQGSVAIPSDVLQAAGLKPGDELVVDFVQGQVVVRDPARPEIEIYTDERIAEFEDAVKEAEPEFEKYLRSRSKSAS